MQIIKLNATDSTNSFLKQMTHDGLVSDHTFVVAKHQTNGRGQMGRFWSSEVGKNLTFSMFKDFSEFEVSFPFYISMAVSLAILKTLKSLQIPGVCIKWPNDILSASQKVCGILIENSFKNKLNASIIGVGLNVNQIEFNTIAKASSLKKITGKTYDLETVLQAVVKHMLAYLKLLERGCFDDLKQEYEANLFRKNKPSTFKDLRGVLFSGVIQGVTKHGKLEVLLDDNLLKEFDLKEIILLY